MLLSGLLVFTAAYFTVALLGLNSKVMRDNRWREAFFISWGITLAQTASTYAIAHAMLPIEWYILFSGFGGSFGIISAHFVYDYYRKVFG